MHRRAPQPKAIAHANPFHVLPHILLICYLLDLITPTCFNLMPQRSEMNKFITIFRSAQEFSSYEYGDGDGAASAPQHIS